MNRKSDTAGAIIAILAICLFMALTSGCIEEEQSKPAWGNGDPPDSWIQTFGNDNGAHMDFMQMRMLGEQAARIKQLEDFCRIDRKAENGLDSDTAKTTQGR